jgi:protein SCO1/2
MTAEGFDRHGHHSGRRDDLLGPDEFEPVDRLGTDEASVGLDDVDGRPATGAPSRRHSEPIDHELIAATRSGTAMDPARHDPLDVVAGAIAGLADDDGARVLDVERVDTVDGVGASETGTSAVSGEVAGQRAGVEHQTKGSDSYDPQDQLSNVHVAESMDPRKEMEGTEFVIPRWLKGLAALFVTIIVAAIAFAVFEPIQVLPRLRLAPGYSLDDQAGSSFTSETVRGSVTLYTFASLSCDDECEQQEETMQVVQERVANEIDLGDTDFRLVTIVLDGEPSVQQLATTARRVGADGMTWTVVGGEAGELQTVVGSGFGRFFEVDPEDSSVRFDPGFVLVDGAGVIRGDYRYQTLADDADKLVRHIGILASELKYANGSAAVAYEAAHLFLCYP